MRLSLSLFSAIMPFTDLSYFSDQFCYALDSDHKISQGISSLSDVVGMGTGTTYPATWTQKEL